MIFNFIIFKCYCLINDNLLLFLRFRLFRYLFKLAIGTINVTSNTIECLLYYEIICWTWNVEFGENKELICVLFLTKRESLFYTKEMSLLWNKGKSLSYTKGKSLVYLGEVTLIYLGY